ncbi:MAG TPA: ricin-type beta-trefoil lectin domain protein [Thermoanaerobaculia bacterium]|nr:ricin-type beta-trefoil lectin domain protein [Thermoanaerobaculia bacterium]
MSYLIQFISNGSPVDRCIGVTTIAPGAPVVLSLLGASPNTMFNLDPNSGYITSASHPNLCLDIAGTPQKGAQVILAQKVLGKVTQRWNWLGSGQRIVNVGVPTLCIDNTNCNLTPGNKIAVWDASGECQLWQSVPTDMVVDTVIGATRTTSLAGTQPEL